MYVKVFSAFIEVLDSKGISCTLKKIIRQSHDVLTLQVSLLLGDQQPLLYLLVSTRAVICQFSGRTLLYGPLKFKLDSVAILFCDLSPTVLKFYNN